MNGSRAKMIRAAMTRKRPDISRVKAMIRRGSAGGKMQRPGGNDGRMIVAQNRGLVLQKTMKPTAGGDHWKSMMPALSNMSYLYC
jgi:hypothetical protein